MGEIGSNTWGVDNIVEGELIDERAVLEEEGQRLNRTSSAIESSLTVQSRHTCPIPPEAPATTAKELVI